MEKDTERYLGDGLYASFDGFQIELRAPRDRDDHRVYLEPAVFAELLQYMRDLGIFKGLVK